METFYTFSFGVSIKVVEIDGLIEKVELGEKFLKTNGNEKIIEILKNYEKNGSIEIPENLNRNKLTAFQERLFRELLKIPAGRVVTYKDIASNLETSPRAVGQALKRNPFPLFIPCHRVVSVNSLGGFSAGIEIKKKLLNFEKRLIS